MIPRSILRSACPLLKTIGCTLLLFAMSANIHCAATDLATSPIIPTSPVKPNLMFILDDSGSMGWTYMPDDANDFDGKYGYASSQCNGIYYNPDIPYTLPVTSTDASYPAPSITLPWNDGYNTSAGTTNLSTSFSPSSRYNSQAAFYYKYTGTQSSKDSQTKSRLQNYYDTNSTFYRECNSAIGSSPGSSVFTKVTVSATSGDTANGMPADERQNFANWYSYHRTRMNMMKTASGIAFKNVDNNFRVAFMSLNGTGSAHNLDFAPFEGTQRDSWYAKLYGANPGGYTPLRVALSDAGRIYARQLTSLHGVSLADPMQYSCQKNFTLLSTDGFWNYGSGYKLDGTAAVGNQDGSDPEGRPYTDGAIANTTVTTAYTRNSYSTSRTGCSGGRERLQTQPQIQKCTVVTTDGVAGAESCSGWSNNGSPTYSGACARSVTLPSPNPSTRVQSGSTVTTDGFTGGTSDTLADVAEYYYLTDLRTTALNNCTGSGSPKPILCAAPDSAGLDKTYNNVKPRGLDDANWQHMTTFTLGLGARGKMAYGDPNYMSDSSGDFYSVLKGSKADSTANPPICSWQANGTTCTWPIPGDGPNHNNCGNQGCPENIDDLWHAAVNGRGTYYSATDPAKLTTALQLLLDSIRSTSHTFAATTVSNPNMSATDNFLFTPSFNTGGWDGELVRKRMDVTKKTIITASNGKDAIDWRAQGNLDTRNWASRTIYVYDSNNANGNRLKPFTYDNMTTAAEQDNFKTSYISAPPIVSGLTGLTQFCTTSTAAISCLISGDQTNAAGAALVNYLRGDRTNEGASNDNMKYFRQRSHVLGDIVHSEATYVKAPLYSYPDAGYGAFKQSKTARQPMVYVGANDGMLHAFYAYGGDGSASSDPVQYMDASTGNRVTSSGSGIIQVTGGDEAWAYIPTMVMPKLFTLADKSYATKHQYFVDGTPVTGDICVSNCSSNTDAVWKTILVGGLDGGGKGYYALDITNPAAPKALWEFNTTNPAPYGDANLGYTYGKPLIVKLSDGTWAVLATSGYNNADGLGHLYVLNANSGQIIRNIVTSCPTPPCDSTHPSGLAQISAMVATSGNKDNKVLQVYGGDLLGNLWRFDVNGDVGAAGYDAQLLATLRNASIAQSITTRPAIGVVTDSNKSDHVVVYVGTGRYLGNNNGDAPYGDAGNTDQQSIYAIKDPLSTSTTPGTAIYSNARNPGNPNRFVQQKVSTDTCPSGSTICTSGQQIRKITKPQPVDFSFNSGWFIDLQDSGERVVTNPKIVMDTLELNTSVPKVTGCDEGYSYQYSLDAKSGAPVDNPSGNQVAGIKLGTGMATESIIVQLPDNTIAAITNMSNSGAFGGDGLATSGSASGSDGNSGGDTAVTNLPINYTTTKSVKRTSWRELINDQ